MLIDAIIASAIVVVNYLPSASTTASVQPPCGEK